MKILDDTLAILAPTLRSRVYLQNMMLNNIMPSRVLMLPAQESISEDATEYNVEFDSNSEMVSFTPNKTLSDTINEYSIPTIESTTSDINSREFIDFLKSFPQAIVIYSGMPGVILRGSILDCGKKFLHIHGGYVPEYKGSTTFYYSMLSEGTLGVSAIWMEKELDSGRVLNRKNFQPQKGYNIDNVFEPMARASLLIDVLNDRLTNGEYAVGEKHLSDVSAYYVIHPLLKYFSLKKCGLI